MKLTLRQQIAQFDHIFTGQLFPLLEQELGRLEDRARALIATLELIPLARFVPSSRGWVGRPCKDRLPIANAFVAKAVYGLTTTRQLIERLRQDEQLRQICGWATARIPHESTFSRAFAEFAVMELPQFVHEALIRATLQGRLIGHIARDSTAIEARERFAERAPRQKTKRSGGKRGRPRGKGGPHRRHKGGKPPYQPKPDTRLHRQRSMKLPEMLKDLPQDCSLGVKTSANGYPQYWRGYKLHLDVADGQIPITAQLTSASVHDSQVAIPLATITAGRVRNLYDVMDTAYYATEILAHSRELGHVPIVRPPKQGGGRELTWAEADRFRERTMVERVYGRLKDEFGGRYVRVRGARKVMAHLMFAVLALTADQLLKIVSEKRG
jgi:hypothetical protein